VISRAFFVFFPCNHIINKKKTISGEAKDSVIFPFYFLLHKRAKPIHPHARADARADALRAGCDAMRCAARDAMRGPMRCELAAMQCAALSCTVRGLFAMQCAARGLVAFARCRRRHAFEHGFFRWVVITF
jgi:hypothetical protein